MNFLSQLKVSVGGQVVSVDKVKDTTNVQQYIQCKCAASGREDPEDPFMVVDLGQVFALHAGWEEALPAIRPFYAVKCNEDPLLLKILAALGAGFDCASKHELQRVLALGVSPECIIYANPCKQISHLKYAAKNGVELMTFDNEVELHKVKEHYPNAKLVIRVRADDPDAWQLGNKFGCSVAVGKSLLSTAMSLDLQVVGVSYHVGFRSRQPLAYQKGLKLSSELFQYAASIGYHMTLLDIGGGFPGVLSDQNFNKLAASVIAGIDQYFNRELFPDLTIIGEPGNYFACSTHAAAVNVIAKRLVEKEIETENDFSYMYYLSDGVYGRFLTLFMDKGIPPPIVLKNVPAHTALHKASLWGPTLDGMDKICAETLMPELDVGDWIYFENMGAYTTSCSTTFNGFPKHVSYYYIREAVSDKFEALFPPIPRENGHEIPS